MNSSFLNLFLINVKRFYREPEVIFWVIFFPIIMSWILGVAFNDKTVKIQTIAVVSNSEVLNNTIIEKRHKMKKSFNMLDVSLDEAIKMLKVGKIPLFITIEGNEMVYHFDKNNPDATLTYLTIEKTINSCNQSDNIKYISAQGSRYIDFLIPGLIGLGIMNSCVWGIGWGLVEQRIRKLIRRMAATPMKKSYFIATQFLSRLIPTAIETIILYTFAHFYFGVRISGSIAAFILIFLSGNLLFSGIGLLISSRTENTDMINGLINAITIPFVILSGIFFSYQNFPKWIVDLVKYLPLAMLTDSIRSVFNQGAQVGDVIVSVVILFSIGLIFSVIGIKIFKWH
ncbi:MAG: ABC transporter permease [Nitrospirae bacterium]|nr:ABC transporter permease [Nitrospirota bacterium]MBF0542141.1 ABC transporter permease [Nitrospirota bacterium]